MKPFAKIPLNLLKADMTPSERLVLVTLSSFANKEGECFPSLSTIATRSGLSRKTVQRAIPSLEEKGLLSVTRYFDKEKNMYSVNRYKIGVREGGVGTQCPQGRDMVSLGVGTQCPHNRISINRSMEQKEALPKTDPPSKEKEPLQKPKSSRNKEIPQAHESREPKPKAKGAGGDEGDLYGRVVQRWNEIMPVHGGLPHHVPSRKHRENFFARMAADKERESFDWWRCLMNFVLKSPFLTGQTEPTAGRKRAFRASLEWLTDSEERLRKVLSGDYHDELPGRWVRVEEEKREEVESCA